MNLELAPLPNQTMTAQVISATSKHVVVRLEEWSKDYALYIERGSDQWPSANVSPAVHVRYECEVDLNFEVPQIVRWRRHPESGDDNLPSPLPAPAGMPGPPDRIPIHDGAAMSRLLLRLGKLTKEQREGIAYLIRRAHGQGLPRN